MQKRKQTTRREKFPSRSIRPATHPVSLQYIAELTTLLTRVEYEPQRSLAAITAIRPRPPLTPPTRAKIKRSKHALGLVTLAQSEVKLKENK